MHVKITIVVQKYGLMVAQASWYDVDSLQQQAERLGREDQQRLHRNKKLVLMVDLDQTLIHTTEQHCQRMSNKVIHLHATPPDLTSMSFTSWFLRCRLVLRHLGCVQGCTSVVARLLQLTSAVLISISVTQAALSNVMFLLVLLLKLPQYNVNINTHSVSVAASVDRNLSSPGSVKYLLETKWFARFSRL